MNVREKYKRTVFVSVRMPKGHIRYYGVGVTWTLDAGGAYSPYWFVQLGHRVWAVCFTFIRNPQPPQ